MTLRRWAPIVGVLLLTVLVYAPVRSGQFLNWDDPDYVTDNPVVRGGLSLPALRWAVSANVSGNWHPLTMISHLTDVSVFGLDPAGHHLVNLSLHLVSVLLLFLLFEQFIGTGRAAFVAGAFALHPMHVESVAWVSERKDVLSTAFALLAILAYVSWVRHRNAVRYALVCVLFGCALLSKAMVVTLPAWLLLFDVWPLRRVRWTAAPAEWVRLAREKTPLVALAAVAALITLKTQASAGAVASLPGLSAGARVANAVVSYARYLDLAVWPVRLSAFYPPEPIPPVQVAGAALLLGAITVTALRLRRVTPEVLMGWAWFVVSLLPVIGLIQVGEQAMADRYSYVPFIGLSIIAASAVPVLLRYLRTPTIGATVAGVLSLLSLAAIAGPEVAIWSDSVTLWARAASVTPSARAFENLGAADRDLGRYDDALRSYERAKSYAGGAPAHLAAINNAIGLIRVRQGDQVGALEALGAATALDPSLAEAQLNFANALASAGKPADAETHFRRALDLAPDDVDARIGLGNVLVGAGRGPEAAAEFRRAADLAPDLAEARNGLGSALAVSGDPAGAESNYREALRLNPRLASAHYNLAILFLKAGRSAAGLDEIQAALTIDPNYRPAVELTRRMTK